MRKIAKYMNIIVLWIAVIGMVGHLVIIHDHHPDTDFYTGKDHCPVSGSESDHHSGSPIHCHAFNHVAGEKAVTFLVDRPVPAPVAVLPATPMTHEAYAEPVTLAPDPQIRIPLPLLTGALPLRAPPVLA